MAWRPPGDKPLYESMMVSLLTHICVSRTQWVKVTCTLSENFVISKWFDMRLGIFYILSRLNHRWYPGSSTWYSHDEDWHSDLHASVDNHTRCVSRQFTMHHRWTVPVEEHSCSIHDVIVYLEAFHISIKLRTGLFTEFRVCCHDLWSDNRKLCVAWGRGSRRRRRHAMYGIVASCWFSLFDE